MPLRSPVTRPSRLELFCRGVTDVQLSWRDLGQGPVAVERDGVVVAKGDDARLGVVTVDDLDPGTRCRLDVRPADGAARTITVDTLTPPPGAELGRFATLSDLHLGARRFGLLGRVREDVDDRPEHPERCARAA
ncbi:MAG: hypothetical protein ACR2QE_13980, partial [Acidimicrobiales bacterium]